ncbi:MAG: hypothetical protein AcusKO_00380 [Acuticoccus sp.]
MTGLLSDDFSGSVVNPYWSVTGPAGGATLGTEGEEAFVAITVPEGNYNAWGTNKATRLLQSTDDTDFQFEVAFLDEPSLRYQMRGIMVEQDADNWIRFELHHDGNGLFVYGSTTTDGSPSARFKTAVAPGEADIMRITRVGDVWTFEYSADGESWTTAGAFTHAITVTGVGPYAASVGPGYTAEVDYAISASDPLTSEDDLNAAPVAADDTVATTSGTPVLINLADLFANDNDPDGDPLALVAVSDPVHGSLADNGDGTLTYTPGADNAAQDTFTYTVGDGRGGTATATVVVDVAGGNHPPIAFEDGVATAPNQPVVIAIADLFDNDIEPDGETIAFAGFTQPEHGSLVDNGDGTLTYAPAADYAGTDTFTYSITDGTFTASANVTVSVADHILSDDFAASEIGPYWSLEGPSPTAALGREGPEAFLILSVPEGNYNAWRTNDATRLVQPAFDTDFQLETKFLSEPSEQYQVQGLMVQQDAETWLRFEVHHDGTGLFIYSSTTTAGSPVAQFKTAIAPGDAAHMRLTRAGDDWTFEYSADGETWSLAGQYAYVMDAASVGPYAAAIGPGFSAEVDYFENTAEPLLVEDEINDPPVAADDAFTTGADTPIVIAAADLLANDTDAQGDVLSIVTVTAPTAGTLTDNGNGTYTFAPDPGFTGAATFDYTVTDGNSTDTGRVAVTVLESVRSDDFSGAALGTMWSLEGPASDAALETTGADHHLTLSVPEGNYNIWGNNRSARLLQDTPDGDFQLTTKFLSEPTERYQMQGILIEQDANDWLRFDLYSDGNRLRVYSATTTDGASTTQFRKVVQPGEASHLRVTRTGDQWTFEFSADGETWEFAGAYTHGLAVSAVGPFAAAVGPGFAAEVDYFESATDPILFEDDPQQPPIVGDDTLEAQADTALTIDVADLLANDSDPDGQPLTVTGFGDPAHGTLVDNGDGTLTYTPDAGYVGTDAFAYTVTDGTDSTSGTVNIGVASNDNAAPDASDDALATDENVPLVIAAADLLANDDDPDGDALTIASITQPAHGTLVNNGDGTFTYTPANGYFGPDSFSYTVDDGRGKFDTATVSIAVAEFNRAPVTGDDVAHTAPGAPVVLTLADLLGNDTDADGDALTLTGFDQPANGTLVDNGNGTFTYTPDAGFVGFDTVAYTVSDGTAGDSGTVTIAVADALASDDFSGATLGSVWSLNGPAASATLGTTGDDKHVSLSVPTGNYNISGTNKATRLVQATPDEDFTVEVRFLSEPSAQFQIQGILVEEDANNWLRYDIFHDGVALRIFSATTVDGVTTNQLNDVIDPGEAMVLRLIRTDATFRLEYSADGEDWSTAGSYAHHMTVSAVGPFAAAVGPGFTAQIDYFLNTADPIAAEDGINRAPVAEDDVLSTTVDTALLIDVADLLANDTDADGHTLSLVAFTQPAHGTLVDNGDGTLTYTPQAGYTGGDTFGYTVSDGTDVASADVVLTVAQHLRSDDFSTGTIEPFWTLEGPNATAEERVEGNEGFLALAVPQGHYNAWTNNKAARLLQDTPDGDFTVEAKFLSEPSMDLQVQGIFVEEDADNWLRFDVYRNATGLWIYSAAVVDGVARKKIRVATESGEASHLKVEHVGDTWIYSTSPDGETWTVAGSFDLDLTVTAIGPFAAASGSGFEARIDYFESAADPILSEDGNNLPPVAVADAFGTSVDTPILIAIDDLLANDTDANGDPLAFVSFTQPQHGTLTDNGDGTLSYVPAAGYVGQDTFAYTITDGQAQSNGTTTLTIASDSVSDDFNTATLAPVWTLHGPDSTVHLDQIGDEAIAVIVVPEGNYNAWTNNTAARLLQSSPDVDFTFETRFLSTPAERFQMQGLMIEEDADNWVRFEVFHDGTNLRIYGATNTNGSPVARFNTVIAAGEAQYLRVEREGDHFTFWHSANGTDWTQSGAFDHALSVTAAGPFAAALGPGFVAEIDYFENKADPLVVEDDIALAPVAGDDVLATDIDTPLTFAAGVLLANDTDANGDTLSLDSFGAPANGTLTDNGDGTFTYAPDPGFIGTDVFTYVVSDGALTDSGSVSVGVSDPDNTAPVGHDDVVAGVEDTPLTILIADLLANDADANGDTLTLTQLVQPANGQLVDNGDGTLTYTPDADVSGPDTFDYTIDDGRGGIATATVTVNVAPANDPPVAADDTLGGTIGVAQVIGIADLLANDFDIDGDTLALAGFDQPVNGTLVDNGDGTLTYTPDPGFSGIDQFDYTVSDGAASDTATVSVDISALIDVWYGTHQTFAQEGEAQQWVNVLGSVDRTQVSSLSYSLNGGEERALTLGPRGRLANSGDFNVDINFAELDGSPTDDIVRLRAVLTDSSILTQDVVISYESGNTWDADYTIDWSQVSNIQNALQIVDGKWSIGEHGVRIDEPGYDRILAVGDDTWDNYEAAFTMTVHEMTEVAGQGTGFGFGMLWGGHTDDPLPDRQPKMGYNPIASPFYHATSERLILHEYPDFASPGLDGAPISFAEDTTYEVVVRIEQVNVFDRLYKVKIWESGTAEPGDWLVEGLDPMDEPTTGSFLVFPHHWDMSFGDMAFNEIEGSDIVPGRDGDDLILAVDTGAALPGLGEIDVLSGGAGADTFMLGEGELSFYDDGDDATEGHDDYALIWDFEDGIDLIAIAGEFGDYVIEEADNGLPDGSAIWRDVAGGTNELVGIVAGIASSLLGEEDFIGPIA